MCVHTVHRIASRDRVHTRVAHGFPVCAAQSTYTRRHASQIPICIRECQYGHVTDRRYTAANASAACTLCPARAEIPPSSPHLARAECQCKRGFYALGVNESACLPCPPFAICAGGWALPRPAVGFWRAPSCDEHVSCGTAFMRCVPEAACPGLSYQVCGEHYAGPVCGRCAAGARLVEKYCVGCPTPLAVVWTFLIALCFVATVVLAYVAHYWSSRMASYVVLARFVQSLVLLSYAEMWSSPILSTAAAGSLGQWPRAFRGAFEFINTHVAGFWFYPNFIETIGVPCSQGPPLSIAERQARGTCVRNTRIRESILICIWAPLRCLRSPPPAPAIVTPAPRSAHAPCAHRALARACSAPCRPTAGVPRRGMLRHGQVCADSRHAGDARDRAAGGSAWHPAGRVPHGCDARGAAVQRPLRESFAHSRMRICSLQLHL